MTEKKNSADEASISKRLDAVIRMLIERQVSTEKLKKKDYLVMLESLGFSTSEMGKIFGIPSKDVASWLKRSKKQKGKPR